MEKVNIVVYGTLRVGEPRHEALPSAIGKMNIVKISGLRMYALPYGFPGVVIGDEEDYIVAELWKFELTKGEKQELFELLDEIEGVERGYYTKTLIDVGEEKANIYICNIYEVEGEVITDWKEYNKKQKKKRNKR